MPPTNKETLTIKNFGDIDHLQLYITDGINIFTGSHKSIIAKLLVLLNTLKNQWSPDKTVNAMHQTVNTMHELFSKKLREYNMALLLTEKTHITWKQDNWTFDLIGFGGGNGNQSKTTHDNILHANPERSFIAISDNAMFSLVLNKVPIPLPLIIFGAMFERARAHFKKLELPSFGITYHLINGYNYIQHDGSEQLVLLTDSDSSYQAIVPMLVSIEYCIEKYQQNLIVIELPEMCLSQDQEKALIIYLANTYSKAKHTKFVITTNSMYSIKQIQEQLTNPHNK